LQQNYVRIDSSAALIINFLIRKLIKRALPDLSGAEITVSLQLAAGQSGMVFYDLELQLGVRPEVALWWRQVQIYYSESQFLTFCRAKI